MKKFWSTARVNSGQRSRKRAIGSLVILGGLGLLVFFGAGKLFSGVAAVLFTPYEYTRIWLTESSGTLPVLLRDRNELLGQIRQLEATLQTEQGTEGTIRRLQFENEQFRELLGAIPDSRVLARVIARPPELPYDVLMLDRGSAHGVVQGAAVFAGRDTVIGLVSHVTTRASYVTLVSDPRISVTVFVIGPNIFTVAEGMGNGVLRVRVPQGISLSASNVVLLPAVDAGVLGTIAEVVTTPTNPERHGYITFPHSLQSMQYVSIAGAPLETPTFEAVEAAIVSDLMARLELDVPPGLLVEPTGATTTDEGTSTTSATTTLTN